jgi:NTE family protein
MLTRPDVLVLGGGGVLGEAWEMGLLAGIEDATGFDLRRCEHFVGTSAGAIVAAHLAAGRSPRRPNVAGTELELASAWPENGVPAGARALARRVGGWTQAASAPFARLALAATSPGGALLRAALLSRIPRPSRTLDDLRRQVERSGARFDGRLRLTAVDRDNGRRIVFGSPGAPRATVAQAVQASCTVPWLFAPVPISGREYVDGGMWSATNLDVAPAGRDTHVLCLNPMAGVVGAHSLVAAARRVARSAVSLESMVLRRRGALVHTIAPDLDSVAAMGADFMDPQPRERVLASGYRQGLRLAAAL